MARSEAARWNWRWGLYVASVIVGASIVIAWNIAQKHTQWVTVTAVLCLVWILTFGSFTYLCWCDMASGFVLIVLYFLVWTAFVFFFFSSRGTVGQENIALWLPIFIDLGVLFGHGLPAAISYIQQLECRRVLSNLVAGLHHILLGANEPHLPTHEPVSSYALVQQPSQVTNARDSVPSTPSPFAFSSPETDGNVTDRNTRLV